ncbi:hypothetical protein Tco_1493745 [Tanacetum coccineum]
MSTNGEEADQDDKDLARERALLASLIKKLKCEINDSKNHNKLLESSNKTLVDKLKSEIEDFKNKNKCLESSNNHFKEANTELAKNNQLMFKDLKKFQAELDRYHDVNYASKVEIEVIPPTSVSRAQLKSKRLEDRVLHNNSQGKKQKVEDHHRIFKFFNNKMFTPSKLLEITWYRPFLHFLDLVGFSGYSFNNIEHLANDGEKSLFWIINEEVQESLLNPKNTTYHSRRIRYFPRLRQDQDHCLTLKNTPYPHQQIHRIRYFGQHSDEARFPSNMTYPEAPIRHMQWRLMNIPELHNRGAHSKLPQYVVLDPSNTTYRYVFRAYK